ncbi:MAG: bifunctional glutamate N-acetyltransferase/amino-acid acetyltransferase ArgJ [Candidatus Omnitrophota bacterium]|nr:MAG: bifunctional glutamate N-acetyltransferase/amino-acid acetyltransferase ArgJ [Candidatus Omnitrophota bacterium]
MSTHHITHYKKSSKSAKLPEGFLLSAVHCGIKKKRLDLGLICCQEPASAIGFFTTNANPSYSVMFSKKNIHNPIKAVLVNSGNANCFTHSQGLKHTEEIASCLAHALGTKKANILLASTGIIGKKLPKEKIVKNLAGLIKQLDQKIDMFASSILTTDTFTKIAFAKVPLQKKDVHIIGFAKGAGMIHPQMATMLAFILTDARIKPALFKNITQAAVEESFNSISVDGCMSTNDNVCFLTSGKISLNNHQTNAFGHAIRNVCLGLAKMIVKDAEGATKFVEIEVRGAKSKEEAKRAALAVASSTLLKCSLWGASPNWGRIAAALGQAGIKAKENISIQSTNLKRKEAKIVIHLKRGKSQWRTYTSDLTPQYIKFNAGYS